MHAFTPRRPEEGARWLGAAMGASSLVMLLTAVPIVHDAAGRLVVWGLVLSCAAAAVACLTRWRPGGTGWAVVLLGSVVAIVLSDLVTLDAGATGLLFFLLPPLLAAAQLPVCGAWVTAATSTGGLVVIVALLLPLESALIDGTNMVVFLWLVTWMVARGQQRNASLVAELRRQAAIDPLTGLVTRRVLDDAVRSALQGSAAARGNALLVVDVDRFKSVNDTWGHPVGDQALAHVGRVLEEVCGADAVVSRLGGDELAAFLPGRTAEAAVQAAEDVVRRVRSAPLLLADGLEVSLTVSAGVAHCPLHADDREGLYRAADAALYCAKRGGRDRSALAADGAGPAATWVDPRVVTGPRSR